MSNHAWSWIQKEHERLFARGSLRSRFVQGFAWATVGAIVSNAFSLLASVLIARTLGQVRFGQLGIINSTVSMFGTFAGLGLGKTATRYVAELRRQNAPRAGSILGLTLLTAVVSGGIVSLILVAVAPLLAASRLDAPELTDELRLGCALLFLGVLNGVQTGALSGLEAFKAIAQVNLIRGLVYLPVTVVAARMYGLSGALAAMILVAATTCWVTHTALLRESRQAGVAIDLRNALDELGVLWKFSIPALLSGVMVTPVTWMANTMLVNQPTGYAQMGVFNAANQWRMALEFLPTVMAGVALPILSSLYGQGRDQSYRRTLVANLAVVSLVGTLTAVPIIIGARFIMSAYGNGFVGHHLVLVLIAVTGCLASTAAVVGTAISSMGRMWHGFLLNCLWAVVFLLAARALVYRGALGLASAYCVSYLAHLVSVGSYVMLVFAVRRKVAFG